MNGDKLVRPPGIGGIGMFCWKFTWPYMSFGSKIIVWDCDLMVTFLYALISTLNVWIMNTKKSIRRELPFKSKPLTSYTSYSCICVTRGLLDSEKNCFDFSSTHCSVVWWYIFLVRKKLSLFLVKNELIFFYRKDSNFLWER